MRRHARATAWALALFAALAASTSQAADLIWEVESPFRFFKPTRAFALHEAAFNAVRGDPSQPLPADIIWRTERALNDPDCRDASTPDRCAATAGKRYQQSRLGWAAQTVGETCYESNGRPRRYSARCERRYSWGTAREDYVLRVLFCSVPRCFKQRGFSWVFAGQVPDLSHAVAACATELGSKMVATRSPVVSS